MPKQPDLFGQAPRSFENDAYGFLLGFIKRAKGPFSAEHVTLAAVAQGIAPADMRSWGSIFTQAARDGYIRRSTTLFARAMGHGSKAPGWERV